MDNDTILISMEEDNSSDYHTDYLELLQHIKKIRMNNRFNCSRENLPVYWRSEYLAAKTLFFLSVPGNIIAGVVNSENTFELLANIDDFVNYIFGISDPSDGLDLHISEYDCIARDVFYMFT